MRKLKRLRAEKGLTMDALEERTGVSKRTISEIERGMREPQALTLAKLARALGVDIDELQEEGAPKVQSAHLEQEAAAGESVNYRQMYFKLGERRLELVREALENAGESLGTEVYEEFVKLPVDEQHWRIEWAERWRKMAEGILASIEDEEAELADEQRDELAKRRENLATTIETFRKSA